MSRDRASRVIAQVIRARWIVLALYAVLLPLAVIGAMRIPSEAGLDRLIVPDDPDLAKTREFQKIFPETPIVIIAVESDDPWSPVALAKLDDVRKQLQPDVQTFSVLDALRRAKPSASVDELHRLATGTPFFKSQGLIGDHHLSLIASLDPAHPVLDTIEKVAESDPHVHAVGAPLVTGWLEHQSAAATSRSFAIFGVLLVVVTWLLYRSFRTLIAIVIALGTSVALGVAAGGLLGFTFTIVSALVPLTIMVTTLATLTYLQSRFVDRPPELSLDDHQVIALRNKLLPVCASTVAAAVGFAALAVSHILPIRQMGLWVALGLGIAWIIAFTLFPALQRVLRTPTGREVAVRSKTYERIARVLPGFTRKHRYAIVGTALAACVAGGVALSRISVSVDALSNLDPDTKLYKDMVWFRDHVMDLNIARVWVHLDKRIATEPDTLQSIDRFQHEIERIPDVTGVAGPTTPLAIRRYLTGHGDRLPTDADQFAESVGDVEQLLLSEQELKTFIDVGLQDFQIDVMFANGDAGGYARLVDRIAGAWNRINLHDAQMHVVGESLLQVKIGADLVPTLAESFAITAAVIFVVFVLVFRSGRERILAMLPSLFALLVAFLGLRLAGGSLDVATIIIATTVLGTTENDQLHFFHHMHEREGADTEVQLGHAFRVAGRAIVFATLINAIGFLGLATSSFPPLRHFGLLTATAFVLALVGDFLVLPAALWLMPKARARQGDAEATHLP